jgi:hypothetical protein
VGAGDPGACVDGMVTVPAPESAVARIRSDTSWTATSNAMMSAPQAASAESGPWLRRRRSGPRGGPAWTATRGARSRAVQRLRSRVRRHPARPTPAAAATGQRHAGPRLRRAPPTGACARLCRARPARRARGSRRRTPRSPTRTPADRERLLQGRADPRARPHGLPSRPPASGGASRARGSSDAWERTGGRPPPASLSVTVLRLSSSAASRRGYER